MNSLRPRKYLLLLLAIPFPVAHATAGPLPEQISVKATHAAFLADRRSPPANTRSIFESAEADAVQLLQKNELSPDDAQVLQDFIFSAPTALQAVANALRGFLKHSRTLTSSWRPVLRPLFWNWIASLQATTATAGSPPVLGELAADQSNVTGLRPDAQLAIDYLPGAQGGQHVSYAEANLSAFLVRWAELSRLNPETNPQFLSFYTSLCRDYVSPSFSAGQSLESFFEGLWLVGLCPGDVSRDLLKHYLFERKLFAVRSGPASTLPITTPDLHWSYNLTLGLGRCPNVTETLSTADIQGHNTTPNSCSNGDDGVDTVSQAVIDSVSSSHNFFETEYNAKLTSYVRGGWRHSAYLGLMGAEDETASVTYSLDGHVVIPGCPDISQCSATVELISQSVTPPSSTTSITVSSPALGGTQVLSPNGNLVVDRSRAPIAIDISLKLQRPHLGPNNAPEPVTQDFTLYVRDHNAHPQAPLVGYWQSILLRLDGIYDRHAAPPDHLSIGEALLKTEILSPADFSKRYIMSYAQMIAIERLLDDPGLPLNANERTYLALARGRLADDIIQRWQAAVQAQLLDRKRLIGALPITGLTKAIDTLLRSTTGLSPSLDAALAPLIRPSVSLLGNTGAQRFLTSAKRAKDSKDGNLALTVSRLLTIRNQLRDLERSWELEAILLAAEEAQFAGQLPSVGLH